MIKHHLTNANIPRHHRTQQVDLAKVTTPMCASQALHDQAQDLETSPIQQTVIDFIYLELDTSG